MSQQRLTVLPEKKQPRIECREPRRTSVRSFQGGLHPLLQLQCTIGNRAVRRLMQARRAVSHSGDAYEQEANRVAEHATSPRVPESTTTAQRQQMPDGATDMQSLERKPLAASMT